MKQRLWDSVLEQTKVAQERGTDSLMWSMQLSSSLTAAGVSIPSVELAELLVSHICWSNNTPIAWKFLEKALTIRIVPPMFVLALLSIRLFPSLLSVVSKILVKIFFYAVQTGYLFLVTQCGTLTVCTAWF